MVTNRYSLKLTDCKQIGFGVDAKFELEYTFTDKEGESKPVSLEEVTKLLNEQDNIIQALNKVIKMYVPTDEHDFVAEVINDAINEGVTDD